MEASDDFFGPQRTFLDNGWQGCSKMVSPIIITIENQSRL